MRIVGTYYVRIRKSKQNHLNQVCTKSKSSSILHINIKPPIGQKYAPKKSIQNNKSTSQFAPILEEEKETLLSSKKLPSPVAVATTPLYSVLTEHIDLTTMLVSNFSLYDVVTTKTISSKGTPNVTSGFKNMFEVQKLLILTRFFSPPYLKTLRRVNEREREYTILR